MDSATEPQPPSPSPSSATATNSSKSSNNHALENFKSLLMKCVIASSTTPTTDLSPFIQQLLPSFITTPPNHPPYAWMIENAIKQLRGGAPCTQQAISNFILSQHKQDLLPWAHATLLDHHLKKLCESGILVYKHDDHGYSLIDDNKPLNTSHSVPSPCTPSPSLSSSDPEYASTSATSSSNGKNQATTDVQCRKSNRRDRAQVRDRVRRRGGNSNQNMMVEEISDENVQRHGKDHDSVHAQSRGESRAMEQEDGVNEERIGLEQQEKATAGDGIPECSTTVTFSHGQQVQKPKRKRGRPRKKSVLPKPAPQPGRGRGRPRKKDLQRVETGKNKGPPGTSAVGVRGWQDKPAAGEQGQLDEKDQHCHPSAEGHLTDDVRSSNMMDGETEKQAGHVELCDKDKLDELLEEVYIDSNETSETQHVMIQEKVAGGVVRGEEQDQLQGGQNNDKIDSQAKSSTVVINIEEQNHMEKHI